MIDITAFFRDDPRVHIYCEGTCDAQETCVLYWMQRAQRGRENLALDAAIAASIAWAIGGKHDRPCGPERPIFGLIRPINLSGMQRQMDLSACLSRWSKQ
jgi:hypothetical protein